MAVSFIKEKKKQKYLIIIFAAIVVITLLVFIFGIKKPLVNFQPTQRIPVEIKKVGIDFNSLSKIEQSQLFMEFRPYEDIVIAPEIGASAGKSNPFLP